jgi:hypothetical protein
VSEVADPADRRFRILMLVVLWTAIPAAFCSLWLGFVLIWRPIAILLTASLMGLWFAALVWAIKPAAHPRMPGGSRRYFFANLLLMGPTQAVIHAAIPMSTYLGVPTSNNGTDVDMPLLAMGVAVALGIAWMLIIRRVPRLKSLWHDFDAAGRPEASSP